MTRERQRKSELTRKEEEAIRDRGIGKDRPFSSWSVIRANQVLLAARFTIMMTQQEVENDVWHVYQLRFIS